MAFNPSPQVAAVRDFAAKFGFDQVIIIGITVEGEIGYASYGKTPALCAKAKQLADKIFRLLGVQV